MSFKLQAETDFSEGLKSRINTQCTEILQLAKNNPVNDPHEAIHEIRKGFKKIRGALRLIRDQSDFYKEENTFYRDEGRRISDIRDATSVIEALDDLYEQYENQLYKKTFDQFRNLLISKREKMTADLIKDRGALTIIEKQLAQKCDKIESWPLKIHSFKKLSPSVERVYKRGRKGFKNAEKSRSTEDFHEWRKRVKYLRYQLELLNQIWPEFLESWENQLHELSNHLGNDHDLHLLNLEVEKNKDEFSDSETHQLLTSLIKSRRQTLQAKALNLGNRLYHIDKETFTDLLKVSWEASESEENEK